MLYSINAYKDKKNRIVIIPNAFTKDGISRNIDEPKFIDETDNDAVIGQKLRESFISCTKSFTDEDLKVQVHDKITGNKGWANFFKERSCVFVESNLNASYDFYPTEKILKQKYYDFLEKHFDADINSSDELLGELLMNTFEFCK